MVTMAVFFLTVKKHIFKWNELIKQCVKLKIINLSLINIYYFICYSIACICKFLLNVNSPGKLSIIKNKFFRYYFTF